MGRLKKILKVTLPLALGVVILYFLYKGTDFDALWLEIKDANWVILLLSLPFGSAANAIRGLRWQLLINPLGYQPKRSNLIYAVWGNYAVNFVLPRVGEFWRCGVISNKEKIPFKKMIGTLIIDRLCDPIILLLFLFVAFASNISVFLKNKDAFALPAFLTSPFFYLGGVCVLAFALLLCWFFRWTKPIQKVIAFFVGLWNDFKTVGKMKEKNRFLLYSFGIWLGYFCYEYVTFFAFGFTSHLSIAAVLFVFVMGSLSMIIPSNGGLGPWQAATIFGLMAYGVTRGEATAYATAVFVMHSLWDALCGVFGIFMLSRPSQVPIDPAE
ncbi:dolichol-P-glucose synthetase [Bacteroidia bacterium]|nr:dolichol-P-glucose synthetase [Bacteroidia bacterium]